ncbi:methyltransferase domain-containing protein [Phlyctema vagabunda]|uniref:Methyltransferase domain-containing protein n=1 Tax=Phlyctema vagabunda TaxID=108571 RepID=A0ABR4P554_9HELO
MSWDLKLRWNAYTEPWQPLSYAYWYLLQNLSNGLRDIRGRTFATWYSTLGHHFAAYEENCTPVPRLVGMARGQVLELGPGSGNQLPRFTRSATSQIYGLEPNKQLFHLLRDEVIAKQNLGDIYISINATLEDDEVLKSRGIEAGTIDTVVCMQVLCSVSDATLAAKQIHRLLKPGGQLLFWEHQASNDMLTRLVQGCWNLVWSPVTGGCHLSCSVEQAIMAAGDWEVVELGHDDDQPWQLMPRVWGRFVKL